MDIELYTFEDADGHEDGHHTFDIREAREYAQRYNLRVIANTFEWADSELVEDYTDKPEEWDDEEPDDDGPGAITRLADIEG